MKQDRVVARSTIAARSTSTETEEPQGAVVFWLDVPAEVSGQGRTLALNRPNFLALLFRRGLLLGGVAATLLTTRR